jgi:hypothetical protein
MIAQVGAQSLWDSYPVSRDQEDGRGTVRSRKFADFLELNWAHDPDNNPDNYVDVGDADLPVFQPETPLDQYEF